MVVCENKLTLLLIQDVTSAGLVVVVGENEVRVGKTLIVLYMFTILEGR